MALWMKTAAVAICLSLSATFLPLPAFAAISVVETSFDGETWIKRGEPIRIRFDRIPDPSEGKIAIFIGETDLSSQFRQKENELVFSSRAVKLPSGEQDLVVSLVKGDEDWKELGRFQIRVLTRAGFEEFDVDPRFNASLISHFDARTEDDAAPPDKIPATDATFDVGITTDAKRKDTELHTEFNFLGVTLAEEALQFGDRGTGADQFDLSDYQVILRKGNAELQVGHIVYGQNRYLLDQMYSRGIMFTYEFKDVITLSVASMNGTSIVGYQNFVGLRDRDHNITAGTIGIQLIDKEKLNSRFETTLLVGSLEPISDFNVGEVPDKEKSRGIGFTLETNAFSERIRTYGTYARSSFENPFDNDLGGNVLINASQKKTKNAWSGEVSVDVLRYQEFWGSRTATVTTTYRHERIDPDFKSLGVITDSDQLLNEATLDVDIAGVTGQFMHTWIEDNIDDVPSILKMKTRDARFNVNVPVGQLWEGRGSGKPWWPNVSYSWNRVHQYGASHPTSMLSGFGGFSYATPQDSAMPVTTIPPGDIPDLVSTLQSVVVSFSDTRWNAEYSLSHSAEDNRQPNMSNNDFLTITHSVSGAVEPVEDLWLNGGFDKTRVHMQQMGVNQYTRSWNFGADWEFLPNWSALANFTTTSDSDGTGGATSRSRMIETELAYEFEIDAPGWKRLPGRAYLRLLWQSDKSRDPILSFTGSPFMDVSRSGTFWTFNGGMTISFF